jgi:uncharacterized protein (DUF1697 family)
MAAAGVYAAMVRSVNVGGRNRLPMAEFRDALGGLGFGEVETYVQSGNAVFTARGSAASVTSAIAGCLDERFALSVPVVVRTGSALLEVLGGNPLAADGDDPKTLHVTFCDTRPDPAGVAALEAAAGTFGDDRLVVVGREVFLSCPGGYGRTVLTNTFLERKLGVQATTRNWRTVEALAARCEARGARR